MRTALLLSVASLAVLSAPASAASILYSSSGNTAAEQSIADGAVTQIQLDNGAIVSIVGPAQFTLRGEEIVISQGGVTVASSANAPVMLRLPGNSSALVKGAGSLTIADGMISGTTMGGEAIVTSGGEEQVFSSGQNWSARIGRPASRAFANNAQRTPRSRTRQSVADAAGAGLPVTLGEALEGIGAAGDVIAASNNVDAYLANPAIATLPSGDVARLLGFSDQLAAALGGASFDGASPALVNIYLQYLAQDGQIGAFQAAYANLVSQYLTLLAEGGFASQYAGADLSALNTYLAYLQSTNALGQFGAGQQQDILSAYLAFLAQGGAPAQFVAPANLLNDDALAAYVTAIQAYADFLAGGGNPAEFGTSADVIAAYLENIANSGLLDQLFGAQAAALTAYLDFIGQGGNPADFDGFGDVPPLSAELAAQYAAAIQAYVAFLQGGGVPADFAGGPEVIADYLAALQDAGLFADLLGAQAGVLQAYLDFLGNGGNPGDFDGFGISTELAAQYASVVQAYIAFLQNGGAPADFAGGPDLIATYLAALQDAGLFGDLLGDSAGAVQAYLDFINGGGNPGDFTGFGISDQLAAQYAAAVQAYLDFINAGGIPSEFTGLSAELFEAYLQALANGGLFDTLLADDADFLTAYLAFLQGGGAIDDFDQLPDPLTSAQKLAEVQSFITFVRGGGKPSEFDGASLEALAAFFEEFDVNVAFAQNDVAGQHFLGEYFRFVDNGNAPDSFTGLPANGGRTATFQSAYSLAKGNGTRVESFGTGGRPVILDADNQFAIASSFSGLPTNGSVYQLRDDAQYSQLFINDDMIIGRITNVRVFNDGPFYTVGADQGAHYALVPVLPALPGDVTVDYGLTFATSPTFVDGSSAPGTFDADIRVQFKASGETRLATEGSIMMPTDTTYTFATTGGLDGVAALDPTTFITSASSPLIQQTNIALTGTGKACLTGNDCTLYLAALPGGEDAQFLGVSYETRNGGDMSVPIHGAAGFTAGDPPAEVDPQAGTLWPGASVDLAYLGTTLGRESTSTVQVFVNANGQLVGYDHVDVANEQVNAGSASLLDTGSAADDAVRWARFADGTLAGEFFGFDLAATANGGFHLLAGTPTEVLPSTGMVLYDLVGGTAPTAFSQSVAPGSFTGQAAVAWGSQATLGLDASVSIGGDVYDISTLGGVTDPTQSQVRILNFVEPRISGFYEITSTGAACPDAACGVSLSGSVYGDEAAALGFVYSIGGGANADTVTGSAVFTKGDPITSGNDGIAGANFALDNVASITVYPFTSTNSQFATFSNSLGGPATRRDDGAFTLVENTSVSPFGNAFALGSAQLISQFGNDEALITRYGDGTFNIGVVEYPLGMDQSALLATVSNPAPFLPVAGTATYQLIETSPVVSTDGSLAEGVFDAQLAVSFGISPKLAIEGSIQMDTTYTFTTPGGLAGVADNGYVLNRPSVFVLAPLVGTGEVCPTGASCSFRLAGHFSEDFETLASTFYTTSGNAGTDVFGGAIFGSTDLAGLETAVAAGTASGSLSANFAANQGNLSYADTGGSNRRQLGVSSIAFVPVITDDRGLVQAYQVGASVDDRITIVGRGDLVTADLAGNEDWQVGRFLGGSIESDTNQFGSLYGPDSGYAYALIPILENLPASGRIEYALLGATLPTYQDGSTAPGTFDASMAVALGSSPKIGVEAMITMPDASYAFASEGGTSAPSLVGSSAGNFFGNLAVDVTGSGNACASSSGCQARFSTRLGGDQGAYATMAYIVSGSDMNAPLLSGAAVFSGTFDGGNVPDIPEGTTVPDQVVAYASTVVGIDSRDMVEVIYSDTTGAPLAHQWLQNDFTTERERPNIGSNTENESGSVAGIIGWTRWAGGETGGRYYDAPTIAIPANTGWHEVAGTPATNLPASGTVNYALVGNTNPTIRDGSLAPGSFSGDLAVAFGSTPMVGVEFDVTIGGNSYAINTPGGVADPMAGGMPVDVNSMLFGTVFDQPILAEGTGPVCNGGDCRVDMRGFLAGDGASHVGITYTFGTTFDSQVDGSAVFGAP